MVHRGGRVYGDHLVILEGEVVAGLLEVRGLEEEAAEEGLADRRVVLLVRHLPRRQLKALLHCDTQQLLSDIVRGLHSSEVDVVVVAPVRILFL